ncbi:MAG: hypothetical protein ACE15C_16400 [Phycisphaerae bacterium]
MDSVMAKDGVILARPTGGILATDCDGGRRCAYTFKATVSGTYPGLTWTVAQYQATCVSGCRDSDWAWDDAAQGWLKTICGATCSADGECSDWPTDPFPPSSIIEYRCFWVYSRLWDCQNHQWLGDCWLADWGCSSNPPQGGDFHSGDPICLSTRVTVDGLCAVVIAGHSYGTYETCAPDPQYCPGPCPCN